MEKDAMELLGQFLGEYWKWIVIVFLVFFEITPIKLHPVSWVLGWIGRRMTGDLRIQVADLRKDLDMQRMADIRSLVLDFSNSCLNGRKHTKEEFDHIIAENHRYEDLVKQYDVKNEVYTEAYDYIKRIYRKRMDRRDFLTAPPPDPEDD